MTTGFIFVNVDIGEEKNAAEQFRKMPEVVRVCQTLGAYDMIVEIESKDSSELRCVLESRIKTISSLRSSVTLVKKDFWKCED